jgi:RNA polymerase sigma-70 factor (ECF subfamily)
MSGAPLDARFFERFERIARSFSEFHLERDVFGAYVAAHPAGTLALAADNDEPLAELYLAAALRARESAASIAFESRYLEPLGARLARLRLSPAELDEVKQLTRHKLLVADSGDALRVEEYAGQGRLSGLIQVVATREALTLFRRARREAPLPATDLADPALDWDPGLEILKGRAREAFRVAFEEAVRSLELRQRNLLRLHLLGGVPLEQLAKLHGVHRATVVRWLAAAREHVLTRTRSAMASALDVRGQELESVMDAIQSRLDVSVERVLAQDGESGTHDP